MKQTHRKPEETLEYKLTKPSETFSLKQPISIEGCWMKGLTSLELYNSFSNKAEENNKFELYTDSFDEFSSTELKDEREDILSIWHNTPKHLQYEEVWPPVVQA